MAQNEQPARRSVRPPQPEFRPDILISALAAALVIVLGVLASITDPDPAFTPLVESQARSYYGAVLVVSAAMGVALVATGIARPGTGSSLFRWLRPGVVLPVLAVLSAGLLFAFTRHPLVIALAAASAGAVTWLVIWVEAQVAQAMRAGPSRLPVPVVHLALTIGVALIALSTIYGFRLEVAYTVPLIYLIAGALLAQALSYSGTPRRYAPLALVSAFLIAELSWTLLYWDIAAWHGGAILGLGLYTLLAVVGGYLSGGFHRDDLVRQALISAPVLAVLILAAR